MPSNAASANAIERRERDRIYAVAEGQVRALPAVAAA
jgi:hypothetical protein